MRFKAKEEHPGFYTPIVLSTEEEWERLKPVKPVRELVKKYPQYSAIQEDFVSTIISIKKAISEDSSAEELLGILERGIWRDEEVWDWRSALAHKKN